MRSSDASDDWNAGFIRPSVIAASKNCPRKMKNANRPPCVIEPSAMNARAEEEHDAGKQARRGRPRDGRSRARRSRGG